MAWRLCLFQWNWSFLFKKTRRLNHFCWHPTFLYLRCMKEMACKQMFYDSCKCYLLFTTLCLLMIIVTVFVFFFRVCALVPVAKVQKQKLFMRKPGVISGGPRYPGPLRAIRVSLMLSKASALPLKSHCAITRRLWFLRLSWCRS